LVPHRSTPIFERTPQKNGPGFTAFDGASFAGTVCTAGRSRLGFISPVLKQFSGHASLKSLEEYVIPDELRHNYPLKDVL
jgi:hypothetical protein